MRFFSKGRKYSEYVMIPILALNLRFFNVQTAQNAEDIKILAGKIKNIAEEVAGTPYPDAEIMFNQRNI